MLCKICKLPHKNKAFCSHKCRNEWTRLNNLTNNPINNPISREKMRQSLTGKKQSDETKLKRAKKLSEYYATHPEAKERLAKNVWDKYTSKIAGTSWAKISIKIRERDNHTCQDCGVTNKRLIVHHLDWRGKRRDISEKEMNNHPSNLVTLCDKCHNAIHRHKANDYHERYEEMTGEKRWE